MALLTSSFARRGLAIVAMWAGVFAATVVAAQRTNTAEDDIKAAFLFNFTQFVEWPPAALGSSDPFRICVVADASFAAAVDRTVVGESVGGHAIARTSPAAPDAARGCQILFVGRQEGDRLERWLAAVKGSPVLVVGESHSAFEHGAHINFVIENNRVKFDVNKDGAARAGLTISSKLLRVARTVTTERTQ
ncbi:MAG TPA: YfiR family protein [Vicinamibacterales bacterium]|nr:YfiR family protein [Vicinamibacterales bacterium]